MKTKQLDLTQIGKDVHPRLELRIHLDDPARNYRAQRRPASADFCSVTPAMTSNRARACLRRPIGGEMKGKL